jgi:hypothetical protein
MATKCKKCGLWSTQSHCPGCGAKSGMSTGKKVGLAIGVVVVALVGFAVAGGNTSSSSRQAPSEPEPEAAAAQPEPETPPINVTARALWDAYDANEVSADNQFKGKRLLVDGVIASINKDILDNIVVRLVGGNRFSTVDATIREFDKDKAAELKKGQKISLLCMGHGKIMRSPMLKPCGIL